MEPYTLALRHVRAGTSGTSVVPLPSPDQQRLEGNIFSRLGHLHNTATGRLNDPDARFVPRRIDAGTDRLSIDADYIAPWRLAGLLPVWERGDDEPENGIPALRYRAATGGPGVTFFLLGSSGAVTFRGIRFGAFNAFRTSALTRERKLSVWPDDGLQPQEQRALKTWRSLEEHLAPSIVARRLGLLIGSEPYWIDSWWNRPGRFSVEIGVGEDAPDPMPTILTTLTSSHLSPRLHLESRYRPDNYYNYLTIDATELEIDLRMMRVSR
jgi:hypothetical protein